MTFGCAYAQQEFTIEHNFVRSKFITDDRWQKECPIKTSVTFLPKRKYKVIITMDTLTHVYDILDIENHFDENGNEITRIELDKKVVIFLKQNLEIQLLYVDKKCLLIFSS